MKSFVLAVSALAVLFGSSATPVVARGHYVRGPYSYPYSPYVYNPSVRVRYLPPTYRSWSRYGWLAGYGTYVYLSPQDRLWYYWYGPQRRFLPITYLQTYRPVMVNNTLPVGTPFASLPPGVAPLAQGVTPPLP